MRKITVITACLLAGCASQPEKIQAAYVSPDQYQRHDCQQIAAEKGRVERRVNTLYSSLKKTADNDATQMGVGLVLLWPTLFFLEGGDGAEAAEYAQLKGQYEALEEVSIQKRCGFQFKTIQAAETPPPQAQNTTSGNKYKEMP
jgi:hypothetical protein